MLIIHYDTLAYFRLLYVLLHAKGLLQIYSLLAVACSVATVVCMVGLYEQSDAGT